MRGSGGIARDYVKWDLHQNTSSVSPFRLTVQQANVSLDNPWTGYGSIRSRIPSIRKTQCSRLTARTCRCRPMPSLPPRYSWNLGVQRQFSDRLFASATYIGSRINNLMNAIELNPPQNLGFGPCTLQTPTGPFPIPSARTRAT